MNRMNDAMNCPEFVVLTEVCLPPYGLHVTFSSNMSIEENRLSKRIFSLSPSQEV